MMTYPLTQGIGLHERGLLRQGYFADLAILHSASIKDIATYTDSVRPAMGVKYVFANGQLELERGEFKETTAGLALRASGWKWESTNLP